MRVVTLFLAALIALSAYADDDDKKRGRVKDVNVANTPSVNVANMPNVNVTNMPDVVIANEPFVNVVSPAFSAVQSIGTEQFQLAQGSQVASIYTVPPGKKLVIEYVSFNLFTSNAVQEAVADLQVCRSTPQISMGVLPQATTSFGSVNSFSQQVRLYADENCEVRCIIFRSDTRVVQNMGCQIIGHLVDY